MTGLALMPDRKNILIPYVEVCVLGATYRSQGWGFALFNFKTNKFTMKPHSVFPAQTDGSSIPATHVFGSPIIRNGKITFYSWSCCSSYEIHTTTMNANVATLKNPASYAPSVAPGLPHTIFLHVSPPSKTHAKLTMYVMTGWTGEYDIYAAKAANGPWSKVATGQLPGCAEALRPCRSIALHPELSPAKRLIVSYYLFGAGPAYTTKHPATQPIPHTVMASIPCNC